MRSLVSVCISNFNRRDQLEVLVESVLRQDYPNIEIIIYDNASDDGSFEYISYLGRSYNNIRIYPAISRNPNAMETLNFVFNSAVGEYIIVMDDDAYLPEIDTISKLVEVADKRSYAAIVGANVRSPMLVDGHLWQMPIRTIDGTFLPDDQIDKLGIIKYFEFHGACALFRKSILNEIGFYDESFTIYMNEIDLATRALSCGYNVYFRSDAIAIHQGVGDRNACNKRAYYFIRNYNTVITRNFGSIIGRLKGVILHTFMSGGYYIERILIHKTCKSRLQVFKFLYYLIILSIIGVYRCFLPDKPNLFVQDSDYQKIIEKSLYNGFKKCINDRMFWFLHRTSTTTKGAR